MAEMKNICGKIPMELHTKVRQEIEQQEISTQQFIQQVIEEHFTEKGGKVSMVTRTVAVQVSNELFERFKAAVAKKGCKQKDFLIELLERAIEEIEAEFGETVSGTPSQGEEPESPETENEETTEDVETEEVSELAEAETGEESEEAETEEESELAEAETGERSEEAETEKVCDCGSAEAGEAPEDAQKETSENTEAPEEPEEQEPDIEESFEPEPDEADIA